MSRYCEYRETGEFFVADDGISEEDVALREPGQYTLLQV